jgi:hypothetical protein
MTPGTSATGPRRPYSAGDSTSYQDEPQGVVKGHEPAPLDECDDTMCSCLAAAYRSARRSPSGPKSVSAALAPTIRSPYIRLLECLAPDRSCGE